MNKKKKCNCWYGAIPITKKFDIPNNTVTNYSIRFTGKDEAAIFYFKYCPRCGDKL